jgi:hypothetical protein
MQLMQPVPGTKRIITGDIWLSNVPLAKNLFKNKLGMLV